MVEDILKSTKEQLLERISSPIIGSFVIAWSLWNYKFFVILFSANTATQTFNLINQIVFPTTGDFILRGMLAPAVTAAIYIFLYPYPALYVFRFTKERQREQNAARQQIENETLLSKEESIKIYSEIRKADAAHREEVERLNKEIERLKDELGNLTTSSTVKVMSDSLKKSVYQRRVADPSIKGMPGKPSITRSQWKILKIIERSSGRIVSNSLIAHLGGRTTQIDFDIQDLLDRKLLSKEYSADGDAIIYEFTQSGRRALLDEDNRRANLSEEDSLREAFNSSNDALIESVRDEN